MRTMLLIAAILVVGTAHAQQSILPQEDYISGVVASSAGAEAGVWVIAETTDLPTPYVKIVVTDDDGRFVIPELPIANYRLWVRGYGLRDSGKTFLRAGARDVSLRVETADDAREAAQVYPADHWYSLLEPPAASEFPAAGGSGRGLGDDMDSQARWLDTLKLGCNFCHQLGNATTRGFDHWTAEFLESEGLTDASSEERWIRRLRTGVRGGDMLTRLGWLGPERSVEVFADWTDRIAAGAVPPAPPRPAGIERNAVITLWDWGTEEDSYMHDEIATDKRDPTVNAEGPVYAVSSGHGKLTMVDPVTHIAREIVIPTRQDASEVPGRFPPPTGASPYYGDFYHWGTDQPSDPHNPMLDAQGRVWLTSSIRAPANPDWCREGSSNAFARYFPIDRAGRHVSYYDPETESFTLIDTCFTTHHLQFSAMTPTIPSGSIR